MSGFTKLVAVLGCVVMSGCASMERMEHYGAPEIGYGAQPELAGKPYSSEMQSLMNSGSLYNEDIQKFIRTGYVQKRLSAMALVNIVVTDMYLDHGGSKVLAGDTLALQQYSAFGSMAEPGLLMPESAFESAFARGEGAFPKEKVMKAAQKIKGSGGQVWYRFADVRPFLKADEKTMDIIAASAAITKDVAGSVYYSGVWNTNTTARFAGDITLRNGDCIYKFGPLTINGEQRKPAEFQKCVAIGLNLGQPI